MANKAHSFQFKSEGNAMKTPSRLMLVYEIIQFYQISIITY